MFFLCQIVDLVFSACDQNRLSSFRHSFIATILLIFIRMCLVGSTGTFYQYRPKNAFSSSCEILVNPNSSRLVYHIDAGS